MDELYEKASDVQYEVEKLICLYTNVIEAFRSNDRDTILLMDVVSTMLGVVLQKSEELSNELRDANKRGEKVA